MGERGEPKRPGACGLTAMMVTLDVSNDVSGWLNDAAPMNMSCEAAAGRRLELPAGLFARAAGFFGAGDVLLVETRRGAAARGVPSPEALLARVATMVLAAKPHLRV